MTVTFVGSISIGFPSPNLVTVAAGGISRNPDLRPLHETLLFAYYATQQIVSLEKHAGPLSSFLEGTNITDSLNQARERVAHLDVRSEHETTAEIGFIANLTTYEEQKSSFGFEARGFGRRGKGLGYYAPTSTSALLYWLLQQRPEDYEFHEALGTLAWLIGTTKGIRSKDMVAIPIQLTGAAWQAVRGAGADESG